MLLGARTGCQKPGMLLLEPRQWLPIARGIHLDSLLRSDPPDPHQPLLPSGLSMSVPLSHIPPLSQNFPRIPTFFIFHSIPDLRQQCVWFVCVFFLFLNFFYLSCFCLSPSLEYKLHRTETFCLTTSSVRLSQTREECPHPQHPAVGVLPLVLSHLRGRHGPPYFIKSEQLTGKVIFRSALGHTWF